MPTVAVAKRLQAGSEMPTRRRPYSIGYGKTRYVLGPEFNLPRRSTLSIFRFTSRPIARDAVCLSMPPRRARSSIDVWAMPSTLVSR